MLNSIINTVESVNNIINEIVWGLPMLILIITTGIIMTVRSGFFQVTRAKHVCDETVFAIFKKKNVTKSEDGKAISQFQALTTALAATIGTGNIAGVATAIAIGGPGAVFWMWVSAFFGMMTIYSENVLGIYYRKKNEKNEWSGGAMYYIQEGLGKKKNMATFSKVLSTLFAVFCVLAAFGIGNMTQVNSISDAIKTNFGISTLFTGLLLALVTALVLVGGIKRIGQVAEKLVPIMAFGYIIAALIIFFSNFNQIPYVFKSIFESALRLDAIGGGVGGYAIMRALTMGFKRGVFSNEAGLGSSVIVHCASDVKEPVVQGMWGIFEVFFDTIVVCTLTAFVLLSSNSKAISQSEAFANITTDEVVYSIVAEDESAPLINMDCRYIPVKLDFNGNCKVLSSCPQSEDYIEINAYNNTYYIEKKNEDECVSDDFIYTNLISVKANVSKDSKGKDVLDDNGNPIVESLTFSAVNGVSLVSYAFSNTFGSIAGKILAIAILFFAFTTVLGWSFYGTKATEFLFGEKATVAFKAFFVSFIVVGATLNLGLAWEIADTLNGLMAIPNLIGVLSLSGVVIKITKNYVNRKLKSEPDDIEPMLSAHEDIQKEYAEAIKN